MGSASWEASIADDIEQPAKHGNDDRCPVPPDLLPRAGLPAAGYFAAVVSLLGLARALPSPAYLIVDAVAALAGGSWCALNFWRRRHAHCLITGIGWLALALFAFAEAGIGHSLIGGDEQLVLVAVLAIGLIFEGIWYLAHRTNAVTPGPG
jgi:hypothetical protein